MQNSAMLKSTGLITLFAVLSLSACATSQSNPIYQQSTVYKASQPTSQHVMTTTPYTPSNTDIQTASHNTTTINEIPTFQMVNVIPTVASSTQAVTSNAVFNNQSAPYYTRMSSACISQNQNQPMNDSFDLYCEPKTVAINAAPSAHNHLVATDMNNTDRNLHAASAINSTIYSEAVATSRSSADPAPQMIEGIEENTQSLGATGTPGYYAKASETEDGFEALNNTARTAQSLYQEDEQVDQIASVSQEITLPPVQSAATVPAVNDQDGLTFAANDIRYMIQPGDTVYSLARKSCVKVNALKEANEIDDNFYIRVGDVITLPKSQCE